MAKILTGAPAAAAINEETARRTAALLARGITPALAIVRTGDRGDAAAYERAACRSAGKLGIAVKRVHLSEDAGREAWLGAIRALSADDGIHGILVLAPLPDFVGAAELGRCLAPRKDVDGITPASQTGVFTGSGEGYPPCTAEACISLLDHYGIEICGRNAVVAGRSLTVGRLAAMLLLARNATVTICHTYTDNTAHFAHDADILIAATGIRASLGVESFRPGQTVIDVGFHEDGAGGFCGDADFDAAKDVVGAITPVPGGVGAVTTAILLSHTADAAEKAAQTFN